MECSTSPVSSSSTSGISHRTTSELYTEIPPLASPNTTVTLPSFYDVIRPFASEVDGATGGDALENHHTEIVQKNSEASVRKFEGASTQRDCEHDGIAQERIPSYAETNLYEVLSDPPSCLDKDGGYSSLDHRWEYATLEPYTGSRSLKRKDIVQYQKEKEDNEYSHLHH